MKEIERALRGHNHIVFIDFEATQFSQEMIAIGATLALLNKDYSIKKLKEPFKIYIKPRNKVGKFVENLTGITDAKLIEEGVMFYDAMSALKKYVGIFYTKSSFFVYGNGDFNILGATKAYNMNYPKELVNTLQKNMVDFSAIIEKYVKSDNNTNLSLVNLCKKFNIELHEPAHDPVADAVNLAHLYDAFIRQKDFVAEEYLKVLHHSSHNAPPIAKIIEQLVNNKEVTPEDFKKYIRKSLD